MGIEGVVTAEGSNWKRIRKALSPAFTERSLCSFLPEFREITGRLLQVWNHKATGPAMARQQAGPVTRKIENGNETDFNYYEEENLQKESL